MSLLCKKIMLIVALITSISSLSVLSMEDEKLKESVTQDFMHYLHNCKLPPVYYLHRIQSEDFDGKSFTFHYDKQDAYLRDLAHSPNRFLYAPKEKPEVVEVTTGNSSLIKVECMVQTKLNSSIPTKFEMIFEYKRKL
jgi:hypothetical protein